MKKCIALILILVCEVYGMALLGYTYQENPNGTILGLIIGAICVCALTSLLFTFILVPKKKKKVDNSKECPYFIEKYDDMVNPEYIDRNIK